MSAQNFVNKAGTTTGASEDEGMSEREAPRKNKKVRGSVQNSEMKRPLSKRSAMEDYQHFESIEASKKQIAQDTPSYQGARMASIEKTVKTKFSQHNRPRNSSNTQNMPRSN